MLHVIKNWTNLKMSLIPTFFWSEFRTKLSNHKVEILLGSEMSESAAKYFTKVYTPITSCPKTTTINLLRPLWLVSHYENANSTLNWKTRFQGVWAKKKQDSKQMRIEIILTCTGSVRRKFRWTLRPSGSRSPTRHNRFLSPFGASGRGG